MAVIGKIRKRVGLLIGFIGLSLILFVLGDLVTNNSALFGPSDVIGEAKGEKIRYAEFESKVEQLLENYKLNTKSENVDQAMQDNLREQAWNAALNEIIMGSEYKAMGIACGEEELYDMIAGANPHPQIKQAFTDKNTGAFNPQDVIRFLKDLPNREESLQKQWKVFEDAIIEERIAEKYKNLVKGGVYVTKAEAKNQYEENGRSASIRFVRLDPYAIPDTAVKVESSDLKAYYNAHTAEYKQDETVRKVEYVAFDIKASDEDRSDAITWIESRKPEFELTENDSLFVYQNSDVPFDAGFKAKGSLSPELDSVVFKANVGYVHGPYFENNSFRLAKVAATKMVSDSVKARHILIKIVGNDTAAAMSKADSLKALVKKGQKFSDLASRFSEDPGSAVKGGDLGWFKQGMMVPPFNDACFNGNKGEMPIVVSQFGVHFIEIMEKGVPSKQVQLAIVARDVEASQKTYDKIYQEAFSFASKNQTAALFDSACIKQGLNKRIADNLKEIDKTIAGLEQPRELVRWAYKATVGEVSKVFTFGNKYVVAKLSDVKEKGTLTLEHVKEQVKASVLKQKKSELLLEEIKTKAGAAKTIEDAANLLASQVQASDNINFSGSYVQNIGNEPKMIGKIFTMKQGELSQPLIGENGVFLWVVEKVNEPLETTDYSANKKQLEDMRKQRSEYEVYNALKEKAKVTDNRGKFY